jgi:hypothetical protein
MGLKSLGRAGPFAIGEISSEWLSGELQTHAAEVFGESGA